MTFAERLTGLGFSSYDAYLQSDHWQSFKADYYRSGRLMHCAVCRHRRIQLHHHTYKRLGQERLTDVTPLCREHHKAVHAWLKVNKAFVDQTPKAIKALRAPTPAPVKKRTPEQRKAWADKQAARIARRAERRARKQQQSKAETRRQSEAVRRERDASLANYHAEQQDNPLAKAIAEALTGRFLQPFGHPINRHGHKPKKPKPPKTKGPAQAPPPPKKMPRILRPRPKT